jgi:hypothetical protein
MGGMVGDAPVNDVGDDAGAQGSTAMTDEVDRDKPTQGRSGRASEIGRRQWRHDRETPT